MKGREGRGEGAVGKQEEEGDCRLLEDEKGGVLTEKVELQVFQDK